MPSDQTETDVAVILSREHISMPLMLGQSPDGSPEELFGGEFARPPVHPERAMQATKSSGELASVLHAVAEGCAGTRYEIVPRAGVSAGFRMDDHTSWPAEVRRQNDRLQALVQAGFHGAGAKSLRQGFYEQEHDRVMLGWGGVVVMREPKSRGDGMPPPPYALSRFQACGARFTRPSRHPTMVPVPITLIDGSVLWVEEVRYFRKIAFESGGSVTWYKQYGDWRAMDQRTGKYSPGNRRLPAVSPGMPASYKAGSLPEGAIPALEVMHWATSFPGADPYGVSGWHSEMKSVDVSYESSALLFDYLKSGLHSVILAAGTRSFEDGSVKSAVNSIDELGRGRRGLGALITLNLVPSESAPAAPAQVFGGGAAQTMDRGRIIFHELNTRLPDQLIDGTIKQSSGDSFARSERIPNIILGRSDAYNFATAAAAWQTTNQLRFSPHIEERNAFLSRMTVEMGVTFWTVQCKPADWASDTPLAGIASVASQYGGVRINDAMSLLSQAVDVKFTKFEEWWGDIPMPILAAVLNSSDPPAILRLLGLDDAADKWQASDPSQVIKRVNGALDRVNGANRPVDTGDSGGVTNG